MIPQGSREIWVSTSTTPPSSVQASVGLRRGELTRRTHHLGKGVLCERGHGAKHDICEPYKKSTIFQCFFLKIDQNQ